MGGHVAEGCLGREGDIVVGRSLVAEDAGLTQRRNHESPDLVHHLDRSAGEHFNDENKHTSTLGDLGGCWRRKLRIGQLAADHVEIHQLQAGHSLLHREFRTTVDAEGSLVDRSLDLAAHSLGSGRTADLGEDSPDRLGVGRSSWSPGTDCMGAT